MATPAPAPAAVARMGSEYGPVKAGDSLSRIAEQVGEGSGQSLDQTMIALLRANPEAFISDNINRLKQGAVLRVPTGDVAAVDAAEATALVQAQTQTWRAETRRAVQQPGAAEGREAAAPAVAEASRPAGRRTADARLEIVPPGASNAQRAGTQSGIQAGGEGEMLRQELQQTKETLAARDAEVAEMKARIDELEKLQAQQQQLAARPDEARRLGFTVQKLRAGSRAPASWSDRPHPLPDNCRPGFRRRPCVRLHLTHAPTVPQKLWPKHKTPKKRPSRNRLRPKRRKKSRNATRRPAVNHGPSPDRRTNSSFG